MATEKLNHSRKRGRVGLRGWLLYLLLVCFALTGVTFSRYVASSYGSDAARTAYLGELTVTETGSETYGGRWVVTPGVDITKNARVIFDKGEMACFVFLRLDTERRRRLLYLRRRPDGLADGGGLDVSHRRG